MHELVALLSVANRAYYHENAEVMSDFEYDRLYDELLALEAETGIVLAGSPTQQVGYEVVGALEKATHTTPMLSLNKTKDTSALLGFIGAEEGLLSWKLDGLTLVLSYQDGKLQRALTRGNGTVGEDVTHNARVFANIPLTVPFNGSFTIRGEAVIPFANFEAINSTEAIKYKNPRNLCSGTVRQLNSEIAAKRFVMFYAFGLVQSDSTLSTFATKSEQLVWVKSQGFDLAHYEHVNASNLHAAVEIFRSKIETEPVASDGLVLTYDNIAYSEGLGITSKFPKDSIAFKWQDELAETTLVDIEFSTSRTGLINPVAIFNPVDLEGTQVSRASLHNISILKALELCIGDTIVVYKANMIIPQVADNLTRSGKHIAIPTNCVTCGAPAIIEGNPEMLMCTNKNCAAQIVQSFSHFVSRDALNIEGLSEQTIEKLLQADILQNFCSLFSLHNNKETITSMEGFGEKSYAKLIDSIEASRNVALPNLIYALGINHVGLANAKLLCKYYKHDPLQIAQAAASNAQDIIEIKGFGGAIASSLHNYFSQENNMQVYLQLLQICTIKEPASMEDAPLEGLVFVVTGDVEVYQNRKSLQQDIENLGGRIATSVSAKTSFLINNNATSTSGKNKKATQLGVPIITEHDFIARFVEKFKKL